jgi:heme-degrading monooxygenase HmoA
VADVEDRFTTGNWTVKEGSEDEFTSRWTEFTTWALENSPGAEFFYLIRSDSDPRRFVSVGAWSDRQAVDAWRSSAEFGR